MGSEVRGGVVTGIELIEAGYRGVNGVSIDGSCRRIDGIDGIDGL
jgi:regulator of RNase E activity RraA